MSQRPIVITGANGYIGHRVLRQARMQGARCYAWSRSRPLGQSEWQQYALDKSPPDVSQAIGGIIHLAADLKFAHPIEVEIAALEKLADIAKRNQTSLVYVSSQTVANPVTEYGRRKRALEVKANDLGAVVVRPGLVMGGRYQAGIQATLLRLARLPISVRSIPAIEVQPVHVDYLAERLLDLAHSRQSPKTIHIGSTPVPIDKIIASFRARLGYYRAVPIPVPQILISILVRCWQLPVLIRVKSVLTLQRMDCSDQCGAVLTEILSQSSNPQRRALLEEGRALLIHVSSAADFGAMKRYVRFAEHRGLKPLSINLAVLRSSRALRKVIGQQSGLPGINDRLTAATMIAEAVAGSQDRFQLRRDIGFMRAMVSLFWPAFRLAVHIVRSRIRGVGRV